MVQERARRLLQIIRELLTELEAEVERLALDAMTDPLTGIHNRRFFELRLGQEVERAHRYGGRVALVLIDLDDFKEFNERYGHRRGDQVLAAVAHLLAAGVRDPDVVCRYGGEEFALILPETDEEGAVRLCLRLRDRVRQELFEPVSFSAGVAVCPEDAAHQGDLVDAADRALYRAKASGKAAVATATGRIVRTRGGEPGEPPRQPAREPPPPQSPEPEVAAVMEAVQSLAGQVPVAPQAGPAAAAAAPGEDAGDGASGAGGAGGPHVPAVPAQGTASVPGERGAAEEGPAGERPTARPLASPVPVQVGFPPEGELPRAIWLGRDLLRVEAAALLPDGSGYRVYTAAGSFVLQRTPDGGWLLRAG